MFGSFVGERRMHRVHARLERAVHPRLRHDARVLVACGPHEVRHATLRLNRKPARTGDQVLGILVACGFMHDDARLQVEHRRRERIVLEQVRRIDGRAAIVAHDDALHVRGIGLALDAHLDRAGQFGSGCGIRCRYDGRDGYDAIAGTARGDDSGRGNVRNADGVGQTPGHARAAVLSRPVVPPDDRVEVKRTAARLDARRTDDALACVRQDVVHGELVRRVVDIVHADVRNRRLLDREIAAGVALIGGSELGRRYGAKQSGRAGWSSRREGHLDPERAGERKRERAHDAQALAQQRARGGAQDAMLTSCDAFGPARPLILARFHRSSFPCASIGRRFARSCTPVRRCPCTGALFCLEHVELAGIGVLVHRTALDVGVALPREHVLKRFHVLDLLGPVYLDLNDLVHVNIPRHDKRDEDAAGEHEHGIGDVGDRGQRVDFFLAARATKTELGVIVIARHGIAA